MLDPESPTRTARDDVRLVDPPRIVPGLADATGEQLAATTRGSLPAPSVPRLYDFLVVCNRLPVELHAGDGGQATWSPSPGGLVTAMEPVLRDKAAVWVGWSGHHIDDTIPVSAPPPGIGPCDLHEVGLARDEVEEYYEGFSNETLWPLYHDAVVDSGVPPALVGVYLRGQPAVRRGRRRGWRPRAPPSGCTTTSCSWCRRCCARCDPTCGSASSCTSRSRRSSCSCSCRGAGRSSRGCSAPTSSASNRRAAPATSSRWPTGCSGSRRATTPSTSRRVVEGSVTARATSAPSRSRSTPPRSTSSPATRRSRRGRRAIREAARQPEAHHARRRPARLHQGHRRTAQRLRASCSPRAGSTHRDVFIQIATPSRENVEDYQRMRDEIDQLVGARSTATHGTHRAAADPLPAPAVRRARSSSRSTSRPT